MLRKENPINLACRYANSSKDKFILEVINFSHTDFNLLLSINTGIISTPTVFGYIVEMAALSHPPQKQLKIKIQNKILQQKYILITLTYMYWYKNK